KITANTDIYTLSLHDALPIFQLGIMHAKGQGIPIDEQKAVELFKKAAEQGNDEGICQLGVMTFEGRGVPRDLEEGLIDRYLRHRSEEHTSELQSRFDLVCRLL